MKKTLLQLILLFSAGSTLAQSGTFDPTFNAGSIGQIVSFAGPSKIISASNETAFVNTTYGAFTPDPQSSNTNGSFSLLTNNVSTNTISTNTIHSLQFSSQYDEITDFELNSSGKMAITGYRREEYMIPNYEMFLGLVNSTTGAMDANFNGGNYVILQSSGSFIGQQVEIQSDDKILVSGWESLNNFFIRRYNSNGTIDVNFGSSGVSYLTVLNGSNQEIRDMKILSNGKILIIGDEYSAGGKGFIAQFNADGTTDNTFGTNGVVELNFDLSGNTYLSAFDVSATGEIYVVGYHYNGGASGAILKLSSTGVLDINYPFFYGSNTSFSDVKCMPNNKILVSGSISNSLSDPYDGLFIMLNSDANMDVTFGTSGETRFVNTGLGNGIDITDFDMQSDGKVIFVCTAGAPYQSATYAGRMLMSASINGIEKQENQELSVYPNPAKEFLTIEIKTPTTITVSDVNGSELLLKELNGSTQLNLSTFAPGVYFIRTFEGQTVKFIKE
ncbi:MAG: hypothetical protein RI883_2512 [Bacteroidota bacterium]|jgi:uncharacterized delta-60 repeat protein